MKKNWLWDRKRDILKAKEIFKDPKHKEFVLLASLLLARNNKPKEIFKDYIKPILFCRYWPAIKKRMRKNSWDEPRIIFWQVISPQMSRHDLARNKSG